MHYGRIATTDIANGTGVRVSLYVSGCTNHCPGCFQPETWDFSYGSPYDQSTEDLIVRELEKSYYEGLTILGGEPFEPSNQLCLAPLVLRVAAMVPERTIWMYTGFTYDQDLMPGQRRYTEVTDSILDHIDVLVDGRFLIEKKNISLAFRGSENQRIIDMPQTREKRQIILHPLQFR
ncbi:MAG: anaerobic ribonucleoside-triphosphate reductase activating protein [Blautia sp.]|nr:anaerobic ribonucleoside-triphosphate reductase activating protein [Blautia sp.]